MPKQQADALSWTAPQHPHPSYPLPWFAQADNSAGDAGTDAAAQDRHSSAGSTADEPETPGGAELAATAADAAAKRDAEAAAAADAEAAAKRDADAARLAAAASPAVVVPAPAADLVRRTDSAISDAAALAVMQVSPVHRGKTDQVFDRGLSDHKLTGQQQTALSTFHTGARCSAAQQGPGFRVYIIIGRDQGLAHTVQLPAAVPGWAGPASSSQVWCTC